MVYAEALTKFNRADEAKDLLMALASKRPNDEYVWYHLAEAAGLANDIPEVHWARAEYFTLNGNYDQALKQLEYGLPLVKRNFQLEAKMKQKMNELWQHKTRK